MLQMKNSPFLVTRACQRILAAKRVPGSSCPLERLELIERFVLGQMITMGVKADDPSAGFYVKVDTLREAADASKATIDRAIGRLKELGLVARVQEKKRGDRPSVANTKLTDLGVEKLFSGASSMRQSGASPVSHINRETYKYLDRATENPPVRERGREDGEGFLSDKQQPSAEGADHALDGAAAAAYPGQKEKESENPITAFLEEAASGPKKEFTPPEEVLECVKGLNLSNKQIGKVLSECSKAGINFQHDYWPVYWVEVCNAADKMAYMLKTIGPNVKLEYKKMIEKAAQKKIEEENNKKLENYKRDINKFIGRIFDHAKKSDFEVQVSSAELIEEVYKNVNRKRISIFDFYKAKDEGLLKLRPEIKPHIAKVQAVAQAETIFKLEDGDCFKHATRGIICRIENGQPVIINGPRKGHPIAKDAFLLELKRTIYKPHKIEPESEAQNAE